MNCGDSRDGVCTNVVSDCLVYEKLADTARDILEEVLEGRDDELLQ